MRTIQIGSLTLNGQLLLVLLFGLAGWAAVQLYTRRHPDADKLRNIATNAFLIWLLVWKLSQLLWNPAMTIANPMSLLYFNGGTRGFWTACLVTAGYVALHSWRARLPLIAIVRTASVYLLIGAILTVVASGVMDYVEGNNTPIKQGDRAPIVELDDSSADPVRLSDYRGKVVLLNFWATWCPPCKAELPHMQKFYEDYGDEAVVLAVNMTTTESSPGHVKEFVEEYGLTFPVVLDVDGVAMKTYMVRSYPTTYVIDRDGVMHERFVGPIDYETMVRTVEKHK